MDLYAVYDVNDSHYTSGELLLGLFCHEANARKELERAKDSLIAARHDSRFKQWWVEEPLDPFVPDTIARYRLYDDGRQRTGQDSNTEYLVELRVLQTGDEP